MTTPDAFDEEAIAAIVAHLAAIRIVVVEDNLYIVHLVRLDGTIKILIDGRVYDVTIAKGLIG